MTFRCLECGGALLRVVLADVTWWRHFEPTTCPLPAPDDEDGLGTPTLFMDADE